jgi:hypothetical protein
MDLHERQMAVERLQDNRRRVLAAVDGLSREELIFRPAEEQWSVADCLEHINLVETRIFMGIQHALAQPAQPELCPTVTHKLETLIRAVPDRSRKVGGPPEVMPRREWTDFSEVVDEFERVRGRTLQFADETPRKLREHFFPHFIFKEMDCYQWLVMIGLHADRHVLQMEEVKAVRARASA